MLLLLVAIIAGALTILAPCVLPVLPVIIGGSLGGKADKTRPYIITGSLVASIIIFTLLLKVSTLLINIPPQALTIISGGIIILLGLVSAFPTAWEDLLGRTGWQAGAQRFLGRSDGNQNEYVGPVLTGLALGPVFSTCSPTYAFILASVLPRHLGSGLIYLVAYCVGLAATLLAVVLLGKKFIKQVSWAVDTHSLFRRLTGVLFIIVGITVMSGFEIKAELWAARHLPFNEAGIEQRLLDSQASNQKIKVDKRLSDKQLFNVTPGIAAPELAGLTYWINSKPLQLSELHGKVVLLDFWTYSCINCMRTLPYVEKWQQTYSSQGFTVIGVHTPEFAFEKVPANVSKFAKLHGLTYPIALDNNYGTWNAFGNNSWPAHYLIDKQGKVRSVKLGEGDYDKTERAIQALLGEDKPLTTPTSAVPFNPNQTPETYFGSARTANYVGTPALKNGNATYTESTALAVNQWTLNGDWSEAKDKLTSNSAGSTITFHTQSKDVYLVAGSATDQPQSVGVKLPDGSTAYGADVTDGQIMVAGSRLYHIVSLPAFGETAVTLTVPAGVSLYTFTFGS
jgi:cytochrome c biogenesis protein CcdA/thiol-disulfide isomerase/thioredoxin